MWLKLETLNCIAYIYHNRKLMKDNFSTQAQFIPNLIFSGVLDRFPRLRYAVTPIAIIDLAAILPALRGMRLNIVDALAGR